MGSSNDLIQLIQFAKELLPTLHTDELAVEKLEQYASRFDVWFTSWQKTITELDKAPPEVNELLTLHQELVAQALLLQGSASLKLREQKKLGKGILTYADVRPKHMSTIKTKRG